MKAANQHLAIDATLGIFTQLTPSLPATLAACLVQPLTCLPREVMLVVCPSAHRKPESEQANRFVLDRLADLCAARCVGFSVVYATQEGVRHGRDELLALCHTPYLWMVDDDVLPEASALPSLLNALHPAVVKQALGRELISRPPAFVAGAKIDVANLRRYPDWSLASRVWPAGVTMVQRASDLNHYYVAGDTMVIPTTCFLDTGHCLLDTAVVAQHGLRFDLNHTDETTGGEDTLFAQQAWANKCPGIFYPTARAWHLEKPAPRFSDASYREKVIESQFNEWLARQNQIPS